MYREEVIAKALREHKDKLNAALVKNRNRQKELLECIEENQLAVKTLDSMVRGMGQEKNHMAEAALPSVAPNLASVQTVAAMVEYKPPAEQQPRPYTQTVERRGMTRDRLKAVAFPYITSRFAEEPFEVSKVRDLLDELEPEVSHTYEAAWNLCNDLLREGKLKQAGLRRLPKGIVRLFTLKMATNTRPTLQASKEPAAEG